MKKRAARAKVVVLLNKSIAFLTFLSRHLMLKSGFCMFYLTLPMLRLFLIWIFKGVGERDPKI